MGVILDARVPGPWTWRVDTGSVYRTLVIARLFHIISLFHIVPSHYIPLLIMIALWNRAYHHIFAVRFLSLLFFSSPNLSRHRLDVYHTSAHGVALVRI